MKFRAVYDARTHKTGIHIDTCTAAVPSRATRSRHGGTTTWEVEAVDAKTAAQHVHEHGAGEERNIPFPHICNCVTTSSKGEGKEMKRITRAQINAALKAAGIAAEVFHNARHGGYHYFVGDDVMSASSTMVLTPRLSTYTVDEWVQLARDMKEGR
jgi:hypothetical protein